MYRKKMNKKISQVSEELGLLVEQNEKRIHKLTNDLDDHDVLKVKKVNRKLVANGDQLESVLKKLGNDSNDLLDLLDTIKRGTPSDPPEICFQRVRNAILQQTIKRHIFAPNNDTEKLDDREVKIYLDTLQKSKKKLKKTI